MGGEIIGGKNFFGPNFVFLCLWRQHPFLHKTKGPTRNPISPTPPPPSAGVHVTPPTRRAIFRLPRFAAFWHWGSKTRSRREGDGVRTRQPMDTAGVLWTRGGVAPPMVPWPTPTKIIRSLLYPSLPWFSAHRAGKPWHQHTNHTVNKQPHNKDDGSVTIGPEFWVGAGICQPANLPFHNLQQQ